MKGDWRSAVLCMTSLSRWNERYVSEDSFTGGALGGQDKKGQTMYAKVWATVRERIARGRESRLVTKLKLNSEELGKRKRW